MAASTWPVRTQALLHAAAAGEVRRMGAQIVGLAEALDRRRESLIGQQERERAAGAGVRMPEIGGDRRAVHQQPQSEHRARQHGDVPRALRRR